MLFADLYNRFIFITQNTHETEIEYNKGYVQNIFT